MNLMLYPNFGAEEGDAAPVKDPRPVLRNLQIAWAQIFSAGSAFDDVDAEQLVAWLNTPRAQHEAERSGRRLFGSAPDVVNVVHDKAFCAGVVAQHGLLPLGLAECIRVLDAKDLCVETLAAAIAEAPPWLEAGARGFAFKPRFGSSGRGRVDSRRPRSEWQAALARLQARGGVVVEPWLERVLDLSAQWRIHDDGRIALLGTTTARVTKSGLWQAAEMLVDDDGVPRSVEAGRVCVWDRPLVEQSLLVVQAAAVAGYRGPCGVDAFVFHGPAGALWLRLVEFNARFTAGLVAVGLAIANDRSSKRDGWSGPRANEIFDPSTSPALISRSAQPSE